MKREDYTTVLLAVFVLCLIWLCWEYKQNRKSTAKYMAQISDALTMLATPKPTASLPIKNKAGFVALPFARL
jgi:hypothetical protein